MSGLAAEIAFFGILSLFPLLIAVTAALGGLEAVVGEEAADEARHEVVSLLQRVLTTEASTTVEAVEELFETSSPGLLTLGLVTALWSSSRAFAAVIEALDVAYDIEERRSWINLRGLALALSVGSVVLTAVLLAMLVVGPLLGGGREVAEVVGLGDAFAAFWDLVRWPAVVVLAVLWAATVYHVAPNHRTPWRWDLPGALLAAGAWALASVGLRAYLAVASGGNQVFGTLGGALIVLLWLYLLAVGLLLGGELNALLAARAGVPREHRSP